MEPMVTDILALAFGVTHRRVFVCSPGAPLGEGEVPYP